MIEENKKENWLNEGIKTKDGWKTVVTVLIFLLLIAVVLIWNMNSKMSRIQLQLDQLQQAVNNQASSVSSQIENITNNIDESLKKADSIVADYSYQVQSEKIDRNGRTVPIYLTVRPKEDKAGLTAVFLLETEDGKRFTTSGVKCEGNTYAASMTVPLKDYLKFSVTLDDGTVQSSEKLEDIYHPFDGMIMKVDSIANWSGITQTADKITYDGTIETTITQSADGQNYPVKAAVQILKNGKLKKTIPIAIDAVPDSAPRKSDTATTAVMMSGDCTTYYTQFNESYKIKNKDLFEIRVIINDNYGFRYTQIIDSEQIDTEGNFNTSNYSGEVSVE